MNCFSCETENAPNRRYCRECGAAFVRPCAQCGFSNEGRDKFCGGCGTGLRPEAVQSPRQPTQAAALAPAPLAKPATPRAPAGAGPVMTEAELEQLVPAAPPTSSTKLPPKLAQDDLDRLFGAGS